METDAILNYQVILKMHEPLLGKLEEAVITHHMKFMEKRVVSDIVKLEECVDYWCEIYNADKSQVRSKSRLRRLSEVRNFVFWSVRNGVLGFTWTLKSCGEIFDRDHTTAIHGLKVMDDLIKYDGNVRDKLMNYLGELGYVSHWDYSEKILTWEAEIPPSEADIDPNTELSEKVILEPSHGLSVPEANAPLKTYERQNSI